MNELSDQRVTTARDSLWKNRDFLRLWAGQTISELGTRITRDGIPLLAVITLGATPVQMGFLSASASAPVLLFSLFAGLWVDRLRRRPLMILSDLGRALLLASIPLAAAFDLLQIEQLYLVIALVGVLTVFFDVAYQAYLPSLVNRAHILEGNSKLAVSSSIAELAGPGLAGFLIQVLTAPVAILLDSLTFLVSVLSLAVIRKPEPAPEPVQTRSRWVSEIREGLHTVWSNPVLRSLAASAGTRSFFGNFFGVLYGLFAIRELGLGAALLGITIAMGGAGDLLGSLLSSRIVRTFGLGRTLVGSLLLGSLATLMVPLASGSIVRATAFLVVAQLFGDAFHTIYNINERSLRQAIIPDRLLGRATASFQLVVEGVGPMGALAGGLLGSLVGVRQTLLIAAAGIFLSVLWIAFSQVRSIELYPVDNE